MRAKKDGPWRDPRRGKIVVFEFEDHSDQTYQFGCPQEAISEIILRLCFLNAKACEVRQQDDPTFHDLEREHWGHRLMVKQFGVGGSTDGQSNGLEVETEPAVVVDLGFSPDDIDSLIRLLQEAEKTATQRRQSMLH